MKKSERINREIIYLSGKIHFNLSELMNEFGISKSTALRDVSELESIGLPLYSTNGKNGGYHLLPNSLLPPIYFSEQEIYSIFFSLQMLKTVADTPFDESYEAINRKLLANINKDRQEKVLNMQSVLHYSGIKQIAPVHDLNVLFNAIINCQVLSVDYVRYGRQKKIIQPIKLEIIDGFWYCHAWDAQKEAWRKYRCEYITNINIHSHDGTAFSSDEIEESYFRQEQQERTLSFRIQVTSRGKEHFLKRYYPNMKLTLIGDELYIIGNIKPNEILVMVNYLLGFGAEMKIVEPDSLRKAYADFMRGILSEYIL